MQTTDKVPLELNLEISEGTNNKIKLTKTVYANFVPQHGMEIMDTEIIFAVRTTALAGLHALKHVAYPQQRGRWLDGSNRVISRLFPKNKNETVESVEYFTKQGWKVER